MTGFALCWLSEVSSWLGRRDACPTFVDMTGFAPCWLSDVSSWLGRRDACPTFVASVALVMMTEVSLPKSLRRRNSATSIGAALSAKVRCPRPVLSTQ